jgi:hypothetical protein
MTKLAYKPFGLVASVLGGLIAGTLFKTVWKTVAREADAPNATDAHRGWREVVLAAALEGAVFGAVKATLDRAGASGFARLTGIWPGDS